MDCPHAAPTIASGFGLNEDTANRRHYKRAILMYAGHAWPVLTSESQCCEEL